MKLIQITRKEAEELSTALTDNNFHTQAVALEFALYCNRSDLVIQVYDLAKKMEKKHLKTKYLTFEISIFRSGVESKTNLNKQFDTNISELILIPQNYLTLI